MNIHVIDRLGEIAAEKAELAAEEKALKARLVDTAARTGQSSFEGEWFRATVSFSERATVAWKAIAEKLGASRQIIAGNTSTSEVTTVRVTARNNRKVAA